MLETPNEKINNLTVKFIKQNYPEIDNGNMMQEAFDKFIASFNNTYEKAIEKFIRQFADEEGLSFKCAEYHINRIMNFEVELVVPKNPRTHELRDNPELVLVPRPKTPEELLYDIETSFYHPLKNECEKELLGASERKIKEILKKYS